MRSRTPPFLFGAVWAGLVVLTLTGCGLESEEVTVEDLQAEIFGPSCATAGCHSTSERAGGLDLSAPARARLVDVESSQVEKLLVDPGNLANSYLYDKVTGQMVAVGTLQMPPGGPLPPQQVDLIRRWIVDGAP